MKNETKKKEKGFMHEVRGVCEKCSRKNACENVIEYIQSFK